VLLWGPGKKRKKKALKSIVDLENGGRFAARNDGDRVPGKSSGGRLGPVIPIGEGIFRRGFFSEKKFAGVGKAPYICARQRALSFGRKREIRSLTYWEDSK
jgi:hypothetical protein